MTKLFVNGEEVEPVKKGKALSKLTRAELNKLMDDKREELKNVQPDQEEAD
jgi:hypothetical protein